jgi:hypothetical protein
VSLRSSWSGLGGEGFVGGLVGLAGEEAGDRDVFVERFPVEPRLLMRSWSRCSGVARRRRGNHARGTPRVRPSLGSTYMLSVLKRTWVGLTEEFIPCSLKIHSLVIGIDSPVADGELTEE